ncbi:MAG: hypothetical protein GY832_27170 [Chloroflexi bacterium]|nr:hypothetical protein [Chloroflexota bacterium]
MKITTSLITSLVITSLLVVPVSAAPTLPWNVNFQVDDGHVLGLSDFGVDVAGNAYILWIDEIASNGPTLTLSYSVDDGAWEVSSQ